MPLQLNNDRMIKCLCRQLQYCPPVPQTHPLHEPNPLGMRFIKVALIYSAYRPIFASKHPS